MRIVKIVVALFVFMGVCIGVFALFDWLCHKYPVKWIAYGALVTMFIALIFEIRVLMTSDVVREEFIIMVILLFNAASRYWRSTMIELDKREQTTFKK